jgi:hypothetical protein
VHAGDVGVEADEPLTVPDGATRSASTLSTTAMAIP